jgi:hypothetical protein
MSGKSEKKLACDLSTSVSLSSSVLQTANCKNCREKLYAVTLQLFSYGDVDLNGLCQCEYRNIVEIIRATNCR